MGKTVVAVLFGGVSTEHEVSRLSVTSVLGNLDPERYDPIAVGITRDGRWFAYSGPVDDIAGGGWEARCDCLTPAILSPDAAHHGLLLQKDGGWELRRVDVVFPVLHGRNGEDGTVQGLLELSGIPYVGCGVLSSAACMDKDFAKSILATHGIPVANWIAADGNRLADFDALSVQVQDLLGYPVFVKPANAGSSVGVSRANDAGELRAALETALQFDRKAIIEECVFGAEVECAVIGNADPVPSDMVGEIVPTRELYDYEGKYLDGSTELYLPARIPQEQSDRIRETAVRAYRALECAGLARVDFFALSDGQSVVLNEINTLPGFTNISMYPKLMIASGMSYSALLDRLIGCALERMM